jgi:peptidoglycan/xylan/chitin deacetylase (PgdA/CDA1 family)
MMVLRAIALILALAGVALPAAGQEPHGVVLLYHHVSLDTPPSTSVTPERFAAHLEYLEAHDYEVWPVDRLLATVIDGEETVPQDVVAITFDDAYESVYRNARPMLRERGWPFAVFVNTDAVDAGH